MLLGASCSNDDDPGADDCVSISSVMHGRVIDDQYIIAISKSDQESEEGARKRAESVLARHRISSKNVVRTISGEHEIIVSKMTKAQAEDIALDTDVLMVEPDRLVSICSCFKVVAPERVTWNVEMVGYGDGTGKTAWILDTGVDLDHPDLNVDRKRSRAFLDEFDSAEDGNGHGTHVAGIIGAKNNRIGILGVASNATIVALKVLDNGGDGTVSAVLDGIAYISKNGKRGDAVNISLSVEDLSDILDVEVEALGRKGFFIAIAAGNEQEDASYFSPSRASGENVYTVSAVDSLGNFATNFSNYGAVVDYAAPGIRILSTSSSGQYAYRTGTSQAAPHVAALLLLNNGKLNSSGTAKNDPDGMPDPIVHK